MELQGVQEVYSYTPFTLVFLNCIYTMSGNIVVQPLTIPDAAGIDYAGGDVRHFAPGDGVSVPGIANPTRMLAYRDKLIRDKVNEVIEIINNREMYVNQPTMRLTLPPLASEVITNYRIPSGFEARVLNAAVASTPSNEVTLDIYYKDSTFGGTTGISVVTTGSEASGGTDFYGTGEMIVKITNNGSSTVDTVASTTLTLRPVGATGGGLISPGSTGDPGPAGPQGIQGIQGPIGTTGAAGSPGLIWAGAWNASTPYVPKQVVQYQGSSYVALVAGGSHTPPAPSSAPDAYWDLVAESGSAASQGPTGPAGAAGAKGFNFRGTWSAVQPYVADDVVVYTSGSLNRTFYTSGSGLIGNPPTLDPSWTELFGPSSSPSLFYGGLASSIIQDSNYVAGVTDGLYEGTPLRSSGSVTYSKNFEEWVIQNTTFNQLFLRHSRFLNYSGDVHIVLPPADAFYDWTTSDVQISAIANGTVVGGKPCPGVTKITQVSSKDVMVSSYCYNGSVPITQNVEIIISGIKTVLI